MGKATGAAIFVAKEAFTVGGSQFVPQGATAVAGHPIMKGRAHLFEPFVPTFGTFEAEAASDNGSQPSGLGAYAALVAKAKELGIPATGKAAELEAAIAAAEKGGAA